MCTGTHSALAGCSNTRNKNSQHPSLVHASFGKRVLTIIFDEFVIVLTYLGVAEVWLKFCS
jgi:hypothetical protein